MFHNGQITEGSFLVPSTLLSSVFNFASGMEHSRATGQSLPLPQLATSANLLPQTHSIYTIHTMTSSPLLSGELPSDLFKPLLAHLHWEERTAYCTLTWRRRGLCHQVSIRKYSSHFLDSLQLLIFPRCRLIKSSPATTPATTLDYRG